jgi:hypothetical protein
MKHKGLSWDGGKKRLIAAMALAAVMVLPGIAQAKPPTSSTSDTTTVISTESARGVSWS